MEKKQEPKIKVIPINQVIKEVAILNNSVDRVAYDLEVLSDGRMLLKLESQGLK